MTWVFVAAVVFFAALALFTRKAVLDAPLLGPSGPKTGMVVSFDVKEPYLDLLFGELVLEGAKVHRVDCLVPSDFQYRIKGASVSFTSSMSDPAAIYSERWVEDAATLADKTCEMLNGSDREVVWGDQDFIAHTDGRAVKVSITTGNYIHLTSEFRGPELLDGCELMVEKLSVENIKIEFGECFVAATGNAASEEFLKTIPDDFLQPLERFAHFTKGSISLTPDEAKAHFELLLASPEVLTTLIREFAQIVSAKQR